MFSLRVFQTVGETHTNTHVKNFDARNRVTLDKKELDLYENGIFQIYPSNSEQQSFYTLPPKYGLFLYDVQSKLLLGETKHYDQYIYFRLLPKDGYNLVLIIAKDTQSSRSLFEEGSYTN